MNLTTEESGVRRSFDEHLDLEYSFDVVDDLGGGYTIVYADLPKCLSVAEYVELLQEWVDQPLNDIKERLSETQENLSYRTAQATQSSSTSGSVRSS
jgi:hypothetical protein